MTSIPVRLGERSYSVVIGRPLSQLGAALLRIPRFAKGRKPPKKALIVTHPLLARLYGAAVRSSLKKAGIEAIIHLVPPGENQKTLANVQKIYQACVRAKLDRGSVILALGGGVAGDMAGFAAATYLRGVPVVQIPTSLLAMVDSAIGGKTGVDLPESKNSVGAFHQPALVWADPATLKTLPPRELRNGMAEVIKYGVIADAALFKSLERNVGRALAGDASVLAPIITRCAAIKASVVSKDERETRGLREILNFGHTLGHAIETVTAYRSYKHGEAISIGMCAAGAIGLHLKLWSRNDQSRMESLLRRAGLPVRLARSLPEKRVAAALMRDKKVLSGQLRYVLPRRLGKVAVRPIPIDLALRALRSLQP